MEDQGMYLRSLRRRGMSNREIARLTGLSHDELNSLMARKTPRESMQADPNELLIQLAASAIRLSWTPGERRNRHHMGEYRVRYADPVSIAPPGQSRN